MQGAEAADSGKRRKVLPTASDPQGTALRADGQEDRLLPGGAQLLLRAPTAWSTQALSCSELLHMDEAQAQGNMTMTVWTQVSQLIPMWLVSAQERNILSAHWLIHNTPTQASASSRGNLEEHSLSLH